MVLISRPQLAPLVYLNDSPGGINSQNISLAGIEANLGVYRTYNNSDKNAHESL